MLKYDDIAGEVGDDDDVAYARASTIAGWGIAAGIVGGIDGDGDGVEGQGSAAAGGGNGIGVGDLAGGVDIEVDIGAGVLQSDDIAGEVGDENGVAYAGRGAITGDGIVAGVVGGIDGDVDGVEGQGSAAAGGGNGIGVGDLAGGVDIEVDIGAGVLQSDDIAGEVGDENGVAYAGRGAITGDGIVAGVVGGIDGDVDGVEG